MVDIAYTYIIRLNPFLFFSIVINLLAIFLIFSIWLMTIINLNIDFKYSNTLLILSKWMSSNAPNPSSIKMKSGFGKFDILEREIRNAKSIKNISLPDIVFIK